MKNTGSLILLYTLAVVAILTLSFAINWVMTYGLCWIIKGIFEYDLFPKFWYVFVGMLLLTTRIKVKRS